MIKVKKFAGNVEQSQINEAVPYDYDYDSSFTYRNIVDIIVSHSYDKIFLQGSDTLDDDSISNLTKLGFMNNVSVINVASDVPFPTSDKPVNTKYIGNLSLFDAQKFISLEDYDYYPLLSLDDILDAIRNESCQAILLDDGYFDIEQRQSMKVLAREKDIQVLVFDGISFDEPLNQEKDFFEEQPFPTSDEPVKSNKKYLGNVYPDELDGIENSDYNYQPFLYINDIALAIINDGYKAVFIDKNFVTQIELKTLKTLGVLNDVQVIGYENGKPDEPLEFDCDENGIIWHDLPSFVLALENDVDSDDGSWNISIDIDEFAKYLERFGNVVSVKFRRE